MPSLSYNLPFGIPLSPPSGLQALVFGASGITGWAITNSALTYPTPSTFSRFVGLTARPLGLEAAGLDLSKDMDDIVGYLCEIKDIEEITHVYFAAYVHRGWGDEDSERRKKENVDFIVNAVHAVEAVSKSAILDFLHWRKVHRSIPVKESDPRIPTPYGDHIFYYPQIDSLEELSEGKRWKFDDIRPDAIVGFVPNHNAMNIAEPLALYLSLWKSVSQSNKVPFPGTQESYTHFHSDCSQDQLARFSIYASLKPEKTQGKAFNIADVDYPVSWEMVWPDIAAYFGLNGVGPLPSGQKETGEAWVKSRKDRWESWTKENGLRERVLDNTCWDFMTIVAGEFSTFDRQYDLTEARKIGFTESVDPVEGYRVAFDRMRAAKIIP